MVRASLADLEIIESAIEVLNADPPQVTIEAKFTEISQEDSKALGFDWFLGNTLLGGGRLGAQPGTAPSYGSPGLSASRANPSGISRVQGHVIRPPGFSLPPPVLPTRVIPITS